MAKTRIDQTSACVLLGCKKSELAGIEDGPDGPLLITTDGAAYLVVDGDNGPTVALQPKPEFDQVTGETVVPDDPSPDDDAEDAAE
jgi:hypothetical protein